MHLGDIETLASLQVANLILLGLSEVSRAGRLHDDVTQLVVHLHLEAGDCERNIEESVVDGGLDACLSKQGGLGDASAFEVVVGTGLQIWHWIRQFSYLEREVTDMLGMSAHRGVHRDGHLLTHGRRDSGILTVAEVVESATGHRGLHARRTTYGDADRVLESGIEHIHERGGHGGESNLRSLGLGFLSLIVRSFLRLFLRSDAFAWQHVIGLEEITADNGAVALAHKHMAGESVLSRRGDDGLYQLR